MAFYKHTVLGGNLNKLSDYQFKENSIIKERILTRISELIDNKDYILGRDLVEFENSFAKYCGAKFAIGTSSGTSALQLALMSLNLVDGDEVIIPAHTFISTALVVINSKAKLVLCDIDEHTFTIDTKKLKSLINSKTKAIIPVHLYGQMANLEEISKIAGSNITVIEDASQAHGSMRKVTDKIVKAGSFGDFGCFSFYPTKNLGALGDAGCILTNDHKKCEELKALRNYGQFQKYEHEIIGGNERLDSIQAIILSEKLKLLTELNNKRVSIASMYYNSLKGLDLITPVVDEMNTHVYHQFVIKIKNRDGVFNALKERGVVCGIHYPKPIHLHSCFRNLDFHHADYPISEKICNEILSLPMSPFLTEEDIQFITRKIREVI